MIRGDVELTELIDQLDIDRVIFTPGAEETRDDANALCALADLDSPRRPDPELVRRDRPPARLSRARGPAAADRPSHRDHALGDQLRKRAFDIVASAAALVVLSPVFLVCALMIKLDSRGPVLFRQRRVGRDDERFEVLKFRSMYVDAEARKTAVASS